MAMVAQPDGLMGSLLKLSCFLFLILPCSHCFRAIKCASQWELAIILSCDVILEKLNFTFFHNFLHLNSARHLYKISLILN